MTPSATPTADEWERWTAAAESLAGRLVSERGVLEGVCVRGTPVALYVEVGQLSLRVTGPDPDVMEPEDLFARADHWVAFERALGPGRILARDRVVIAAWDEALAKGRATWQYACEQVFGDLERAGETPVAWNVEVQTVTEVWPEQPRRRELLLGELWLNATGWGRGLEVVVTQRDALLQAADVIQDEVGRHLPGAWPLCPAHGRHPLAPADRPEGPSWSCPKAFDVFVRIGHLGLPD